jgi:hypothetical protein
MLNRQGLPYLWPAVKLTCHPVKKTTRLCSFYNHPYIPWNKDTGTDRIVTLFLLLSAGIAVVFSIVCNMYQLEQSPE